MMFMIGICDDDAEFREWLAKLCRKYFNDEETCIRKYRNGEELLEEQDKCDLLFLDIEMPGMNGIQIKERFDWQKTDTDIVFITSHEENMREAFGRNVMGFLTKPLKEQDFFSEMDKLSKKQGKNFVCIEENQEIYRLPLRSMKYIEAKENYSKVVCSDRDYLFRKSIKTWETLVPADCFVKIHRSYIINLEYWKRDKDFIVLSPVLRIRLSRKNKKEVLARYKDYIRKKAEEIDT